MILTATPLSGFDGLFDPAAAAAMPRHVHAALLGSALAADQRLHLAFPGATDLVYPDLAAILTHQQLVNVGDPFEAGHGRNNTKSYEIAIIRQLGALAGGDRGQVWGYVTTGSSEGTLHAVDDAVRAYPDAVIFASTAAHYSVAKAANMVRAPLVLVRADIQGRMMLDDLRQRLTEFQDRPICIVATAGTTEHEAVDDIAGIATLCQDLGITRLRLHVDAALAFLPLLLLPEHDRPDIGFRAGATSIVVSGHKFLSTLMPCAVLIYPQRPASHPADPVSYIGASDTTITGSRSGHTPLLLHWALTSFSLQQHQARATAARELAAYTHDRLARMSWPHQWKHPGFTIRLAQPTQPLPRPWVLGGDHTTGRIITMPGIEQAQIDEFTTDLAAAHGRRIPRQRRTPRAAS
ncbi:pyridoxal-dependent decarboxylase [Paractinoplanes toevensis]|uniref:Histidine decarboxylase n=1 Tax=Paractinoplanes toevensis TaxID=571911 RepID=A0A919W4Q7_9ACTN|nr:pyridoxal-dependent decarboxylase [Actinoplanes toevensis]GIM94399.1 histidine decarboxylase [Actinoplanes toevensis]